MSGVRVHGTCVHLPGLGAALLLGPPGAGKSGLALRMIGEGALLVADDQVLLLAADQHWIARPPPALAGRMEVRGLGVIAVPSIAADRLVLAVSLVPPAERLGARATWRPPGAGPADPAVPLLAIAPQGPEGAATLRAALATVRGDLWREDIAPTPGKSGDPC